MIEGVYHAQAAHTAHPQRRTTTAPASSAGPILQVPTGWKMVVAMSPAAFASASSPSTSGPRLELLGLVAGQRRLGGDPAGQADRVGGDPAVGLRGQVVRPDRRRVEGFGAPQVDPPPALRPQIADAGGEGGEGVQARRPAARSRAAGYGIPGSASGGGGGARDGRTGRTRPAGSAPWSGDRGEQGVLHAHSGLAGPGLRPLVQGPDALDLEDQPHLQDGPAGCRRRPAGRGRREMPWLASRSGRPDPGQHQDLGRADRPVRQHQFAIDQRAPGQPRPRPSPWRKSSAAARPSSRTIRSAWARVRTVRFGRRMARAQERLGRRPAHALLLVDLEIAAALVVAAIEVSVLGARLGRRPRAQASSDLPADSALLHPPLPPAPCILVGNPLWNPPSA